MGGNSAFGQALSKGFQQLQNPQPQQSPGPQSMLMPEFKYTPDKGLQVNMGNDILTAIIQGMQPKQAPRQAMPVYNPQYMTQNQPMSNQPLPVSMPGNTPTT